jgi:NCS1 family nucleobase:cation symporter-1
LPGFFISAIVFYALNFSFPPKDAMDQYDDFDIYGTFTTKEARRAGILPLEDDRLGEEHVIVGRQDGKI